jgi:hypothetical protein
MSFPLNFPAPVDATAEGVTDVTAEALAEADVWAVAVPPPDTVGTGVDSPALLESPPVSLPTLQMTPTATRIARSAATGTYQ